MFEQIVTIWRSVDATCWEFWTKRVTFGRISKQMKFNIISKRKQIYSRFWSICCLFLKGTVRLWSEKSCFFGVWANSDDLAQRRCHDLSVLDKKSYILSNFKTYEIQHNSQKWSKFILDSGRFVDFSSKAGWGFEAKKSCFLVFEQIVTIWRSVDATFWPTQTFELKSSHSKNDFEKIVDFSNKKIMMIHQRSKFAVNATKMLYGIKNGNV